MPPRIDKDRPFFKIVLSGKLQMMGGTSELNHMMYVRGNAEDYNKWAELGNTGWSYKDVLPYFKKSEDNRNKEVKFIQ